MKNDTIWWACAAVITLETQKCQKRHLASIPGPHRHRIYDRREEGLVNLPFCFANLPTIVGKISTWNLEPRGSVFKAAFHSQNPAVSKKRRKLEGAEKTQAVDLRCLSARDRRLKASRWKVRGHDMDGEVLCCGSNHTSQGALLLLDRPSSAVLFLCSSLQVHVDDKLGDHGAGWRYFSFSRQRALWPWAPEGSGLFVMTANYSERLQKTLNHTMQDSLSQSPSSWGLVSVKRNETNTPHTTTVVHIDRASSSRHEQGATPACNDWSRWWLLGSTGSVPHGRQVKLFLKREKMDEVALNSPNKMAVLPGPLPDGRRSGRDEGLGSKLKRHLALSNSYFDRQKLFSKNERRRADFTDASDFSFFAPGLSYDLSRLSDNFTPLFLLWKAITKSLGKH